VAYRGCRSGEWANNNRAYKSVIHLPRNGANRYKKIVFQSQRSSWVLDVINSDVMAVTCVNTDHNP